MITLTTDAEETYRFNLRSPEREKLFRDAWYSMSDTPRFGDKELRVTTDRGDVYLWKVRQVRSCTYEEKNFDYKTPAVILKKKAEPKRNLSEDMPVFPEGASDESPYDEMLEQYGIDSEAKQQFRAFLSNTVKRMMDNISPESKEKASRFLERLREEGVQLEMNDIMLFSMVARVMHDDYDKIEDYVQSYLRYWAGRK